MGEGGQGRALVCPKDSYRGRPARNSERAAVKGGYRGREKWAQKETFTRDETELETFRNAVQGELGACDHIREWLSITRWAVG